MRDILKELIFFYLLQKSIIVFAPWMKDHIVVDYEQMKYYKPNVHDRTLHLNSTEPGLHLAFKLDLDAHAVFVHLMRFVGCELFKKEVYYFFGVRFNFEVDSSFSGISPPCRISLSLLFILRDATLLNSIPDLSDL